jgi:hypothetical protein
MALSQGSVASWADIQSLYSALNTARTKFGFSTVTVPSNPGTMINTSVSNLNSLVNAMSSNKYLKNVAVTGVSVPARGDLIAVSPFSKISTTITRIQGTCAHDSFTFHTGNFANDSFHAFNGSFRGFSYHGSRFGCNYRSR